MFSLGKGIPPHRLRADFGKGGSYRHHYSPGGSGHKDRAANVIRAGRLCRCP